MTPRRRRVLIFGLLCVTGMAVRAQQVSPRPAPTGAISGIVTDAITRRPIAGAIVSITITSGGPGAANPNSQRAQLTDTQGRFVFRHLPPSDRYSLSVDKYGYFTQ